MSILFLILGILFILVALVCAVIILIDAFKDAVWKGLLSILCSLYMLYYEFVEFDHPNKWLIVAGHLLGGIIGGLLLNLGGYGR